MIRLRDELATIRVLWRRDLMLFVRQKSRVAGALLQPALFWLVLGFGLEPTFQLGDGAVEYRTYFFPGVVVMIVLFSSIFATMSVIEDRREGFLQGVLVGPASRASMVAGKALGSATVASVQALLFLLLAPAAGISVTSIAWIDALSCLLLTSLGLVCVGFALAWWLDSTQSYHVVMSLVLLPAWILSGAVFPGDGLPPVLRSLLAANPMSYAVSGMRSALGTSTPATLTPGPMAQHPIVVLAVVAVVLFLIAVRTTRVR